MKCGECGANYIMHNARAYGCSSYTNGGKHLCSNKIRVNRKVAETAILENIKNRMLSDDVIEYVTKQFKAALRDLETKPDDSEHLTSDLRVINAKLGKLADAIEAVGISATLADRLRSLETEKTKTEQAIASAKESPSSEISFLPDVLPALTERWRELVVGIEDISSNPVAGAIDIEVARSNLHALLGPMTLKPRDGVLWAHPAPNAKNLVNTRLSGRLSINSQKMVAGAGFEPATFGL